MNFNCSANNFFDVALSKPTIAERCRELSRLIDECNTTILHHNFVTIIHRIFGVNCNGWGILTANPRHQTSECQVLKEFLSCRGPMFRLLHRLQTESMLFRYDIPCSMLPPTFVYVAGEPPLQQSRVYQQLYSINQSNETLGPMGSPNLTTAGQTCLRVSAFEFYFYHFAHCIVKGNASYRPPPSYSNYHQLPPTVEENLYYLLEDEYLSYFLPIDGSPLPTIPPPSPTSPGIVGTSSFHTSMSLLKRSPPKPTTAFGGMHNDMWRSDVVVHILVEFWLGQCVPKRGEQLGCAAPSEDLMRAVRRLVKHLHYFNNVTSPSLSHSHFNDTSMEMLKQNIMYNCLQPRLFTFLCYCFKVWPLNSTFRVVLETWLSYIQPWRYTDPVNVSRNIEMRLSSDREVANIWYHFISNNLQFYTRLFYESINRFLRMDISKQANSLLLYRVAKIFSQPNLLQMIEDAENAMFGERPSMYSPSSYVALSRSETSTNLYLPCLITSPELRKMVDQLLMVCNQALGTVKKYIQPKSVDFSSQFLSFIGLGALTDIGNETLLNANWKKSEQQIYDSMELLAEMFDLSLADLNVSTPVKQTLENPFGPEAADCSINSDGKAILSQLGRYEILNNVKKLPVYPNSGPDLQPIRSFENRFLVRFLYKISSAINKKYSSQFELLCSQRNVLGVWSRSFLSPSYDHAPTVMVKDWQDLPPRLSLRVFAHYRTIFYACLYFLICHLFGISFLKGLVFAILIFLIITISRAFLKEYFS